MNEEDSSSRYDINRKEKEQVILDQFEYVKWGEEHPFYSHWIEQVSIMSPTGMIANQHMRTESGHIGFNLDDFKKDGINLDTELLYTGHIEYEERLKEYNIHITNKVLIIFFCIKNNLKFEFNKNLS